LIKSEKHLKHLIGLSFKELEELCSNLDHYYYFENREVLKYDHKKDIPPTTKIRILCPSRGKLRRVQNLIKNRILDKIEFSKNTFGGVKGKNNILNAKMHLGNEHRFSTDLRNFFHTINRKMVYEAFINEGFSSDIARFLTKLTTYKNELPLGAPTSTHIANFVCKSLDKTLSQQLKEQGIIYTRFIDDLVFSNCQCFKHVIHQILEIIVNKGFKIHHKKTTFRFAFFEITGIPISKNNLLIPTSNHTKLEEANISEDRRKSLLRYRNAIEEGNRQKIKQSEVFNILYNS
jgi:RNA-directed DNA polymerase